MHNSIWLASKNSYKHMTLKIKVEKKIENYQETYDIKKRPPQNKQLNLQRENMH